MRHHFHHLNYLHCFHHVKQLLKTHSAMPEHIFFTNITNYICGEKTVMWRNFSFLYRIWTIYGFFIEVYAVFVLNLCGEKSVRRKSVWRKKDKYEVCKLETHPSCYWLAEHVLFELWIWGFGNNQKLRPPSA